MRSVLSIILSFFVLMAKAQLQPGFNKEEVINLLKVSAQFGDPSYAAKMRVPAGYQKLYRSPIVGLDNCWELWRTDSEVPVISIRGTTRSEISWLANFYAAMIPAKGHLQISASEQFDYNLAEDPKAAVHAGWMIATAFLSKDILIKIDSLHKKRFS